MTSESANRTVKVMHAFTYFIQRKYKQLQPRNVSFTNMKKTTPKKNKIIFLTYILILSNNNNSFYGMLL